VNPLPGAAKQSGAAEAGKGAFENGNIGTLTCLRAGVTRPHRQARRVAVDRDMLEEIVKKIERVMAEGPAPQKKHLLHRLVKKVVVHDRRTVDVWYGLPNPQRFEDWNKWLPGRDSNPARGGINPPTGGTLPAWPFLKSARFPAA
jgi:hypothetical protein